MSQVFKNEFKLNQMKSKYLRLSSEDKTNSTDSNTNFNISLPALGGNLDEVYGCYVKKISCPNMFYNIPSYANLLILEKDGVGTYTATITAAQYDLAALLVELKTQIDLVIPDTVTVTASASGILSFDFGVESYRLVLDGSTSNEKLGFVADTAYSAGGVLTLANPVNLLGETELYVHSREINPAGLVEPSGAFSVVDVLDIDVAYGSMAYSNFNDDELHEIRYFPWESRKTLRTVDIRLRNRTGQILELPDNFHFNMILKFYYS